jgi:Response regulator containing a CheY-like receiver domain and an HD-GYP domain
MTTIELIHSLLGEECNILFATSGPEGIDLALKCNPDLILLDVMMPGMDGYEVCRELKKNALTMAIPVIFITVLDHQDEEEAGLEAGAIDYITKPFHNASFKAKIHNYLTLKELLAKNKSQIISLDFENDWF